MQKDQTNVKPVTASDIFPDDENHIVRELHGIKRTPRKGSIKSLVHNCFWYTKINQLPPSMERDARLKELSEAMEDLVLDVYATGFFETIPLENWLIDPADIGKRFVVEALLRAAPQIPISKALQKRLDEVKLNDQTLLSEGKALTPGDVLKDGVDHMQTKDGANIRKGTINAFALNIEVYTILAMKSEKEELSSSDLDNIELLRHELREAIKTLESIDFFNHLGLDLFRANPNQVGLAEVVRLYTELYPEKV